MLACLHKLLFPPLLVRSDPYTAPNLRGYLQRWGQLNVVQTPFEEICITPPQYCVQIQGCRNVRFYLWEAWGWGGGSLGCLKLPIIPLLKFMFLEYWDEGGGGGGGVNQTRQGHVPVRRANNGGVNPSPFHRALTPSRGLYRTQWGEDKRPGLFLHSARH